MKSDKEKGKEAIVKAMTSGNPTVDIAVKVAKAIIKETGGPEMKAFPNFIPKQ